MRYIFLSILIFNLSCNDSKKETIDDIVQINEQGIQENKAETLSVEDVERLMNISENAAQTYTAILNNDIEKTYFFQADTNKTVSCKLETLQPLVKVSLYKEMVNSVKKDSTTYIKVKDYKLICDADSCSHTSKKAAKYKVIVKLSRKFQSADSTAEFTLKIFKN